jgi:alkylation response protein AidB-like acyl-CoA dehydrogenase
MDFELSEDQTLLVESTTRMVEGEIAPILQGNDPAKPLPKNEILRIFSVFANQGLTAPRLPTEAGGSEMKMLDYGMVYEQLPPDVAKALLAHEVTITRIHAASSDEQRRQLLPDPIAGTRICCTGSTEPDTGSDPRGIKTQARQSGDDGRKRSKNVDYEWQRQRHHGGYLPAD